MAPRFACADFTFPLLPHKKALELIALMGFGAVDIGLFQNRSHIQPADQFADIDKSAAALSATLRELGLAPADVFLQCENDFAVYAVNNPDPAKRAVASDWFKCLLDYTVKLGGSHVTILPGVSFPEESEADSFARAVDELSWRTAAAKSRGLTMGVEAHYGSLVQTPALAAKLATAVPDLTLTLDYTHFVRIGSPQDEMDDLVQYASHFHARAACPDEMQTVFERNVIDYSRVVRKMKECGYHGYIGIEYYWNKWENGNRVDNVSETIQMRDHLAELWGE